ncbi:MAG: hypothetical protein GWO81_00535 [Verrucomicrobia bacterium]|nr:hypothetical protein [Verrucomicrobiota bacterium]
MVLNPEALQPKDLNERYFWSRLFMGFAAASCAVLGAMFLMPCVIQDEPAHISVPLSSTDPVLDSEFYEWAAEEYESVKVSKNKTACLAAHLRLQGLGPAVAPSGQLLESVDSIEQERSLQLSEVDLEMQRSDLNHLNLHKPEDVSLELKLPNLRPEIKRIQDVGFSGSLVRY